MRTDLASQLLNLGKISLQKDLWEGKISGYISDFNDCLNNMEDYSIPDKLEYFISEGYLSDIEAEKLKKIDTLINDVKIFIQDKEPSNRPVWESKVWIKLVSISFNVFRDHFFKNLMKCTDPEISWYNKYYK